jgi:hypothetical protein
MIAATSRHPEQLLGARVARELPLLHTGNIHHVAGILLGSWGIHEARFVGHGLSILGALVRSDRGWRLWPALGYD